MYLKRKVDAILEVWKADQNRKPLIIKGSRQIGKTESILHFAANNYENVIEINFVRDEKYKGMELNIETSPAGLSWIGRAHFSPR